MWDVGVLSMLDYMSTRRIARLMIVSVVKLASLKRENKLIVRTQHVDLKQSKILLL